MTISRALVALAALVLCTASPIAAQRAHRGVHGGVNFDRDEGLIGAQMLLPLGGRVELYPSLDYYLTDPGSLVGINVDLKFGATPGPTALYLGGGLNFLRDGDGGGDTGANVFLGLEGRAVTMHPYLEFRVLLHDNTSSQLLVGINWTLF